MTSLTPGLAKSRGGFDDTDYRIWAICRNRSALCRQNSPTRVLAPQAARSATRAAPREASAGGFTCRSPPGSLRRRHAQRPPEASLTTAPAWQGCAAGFSGHCSPRKVAPQASSTGFLSRFNESVVAARARLRRRLCKRRSNRSSARTSVADVLVSCHKVGASPSARCPRPRACAAGLREPSNRLRASRRRLDPTDVRAACLRRRDVAPRCFRPRHATTRRATSRHATPRRATPRHATPRRVTPRHVAASPGLRLASCRLATSLDRHVAASRHVTRLPPLATSPSRTTSPPIVPSMHLGLPPRVELLGHRGKRRRLSPRVCRTTSPSRHVTVRCAAPRIQPRPAPGAGAGRMRGCASLTRPVWCTVTARVVLMRAGTSDGREVRVCDVLPCVSVCARCAVSWIARVSGIGCLFGSGVRIATSFSWMAVCTPHLRLSPPLAASLTDLLAPLAF